MDIARLELLDALSCYHRVACVDGRVAAFLLAMADDAAYRNDNFEWFVRRYPRFIYVDRIVVAADARTLRLGSRLYEDLFAFARAAGFPCVTCEYYLVPPNEPSRRFHDKFGFTEQGTQWLADGRKQVSLQVAPVNEPS
jgi:predicted GNAT superfamily acetyltransferase